MFSKSDQPFLIQRTHLIFVFPANILSIPPMDYSDLAANTRKSRQKLWHETCIYYPVNRNWRYSMGSGSCGNVIAALASFFIPGLGQLLQGRWFLAGLMFILTAVLWLILLGWAIHLWSIIDAAIYQKPERWHREYYRGAY